MLQRRSRHSQRLLAQVRERGVSFRDKELKTHFAINKRTVYNNATREQEFRGYVAGFIATITTDDISKVGVIQDRLTSIIGAEVDSPKLHIKREKRQHIQDEALKAAFALAESRFKTQCETVSLDRDQFQLAEWSTNYEDRFSDRNTGGKFASLAGGAGDEAGISFHATVKVTMLLTYARMG